ncbi:MAG: HEAT repeat domain-containing protein [Candidatus Methanoperedens sp.]
MGICDLFKPNVVKMINKRDVDGLIKALRYKKDSDVRMEAAEALGKIGDKRAVKPLIQALNNRPTGFHKAVVIALVEIGNSAVEHALKDENCYVSNETAEVLKRIKKQIKAENDN